MKRESELGIWRGARDCEVASVCVGGERDRKRKDINSHTEMEKKRVR